MTDETPGPSTQTQQLLQLLGDAGFALTQRNAGSIDEADGLVENKKLGIWIHTTKEMVRLTIEERGEQPGYRLLLGRHSLSTGQAMRVIAVHARAAVAERQN